MTATATARDLALRGYSPIPIPTRQKRPTIPEWERLRISAAEVPKYFRANSNVGILNGEPSGWIVDIDLDHELARELADDYLPATGAEFGRASSPRSHRLYRVTGPVETHQRRLPKVNGKAPMVVELRSTGSQTIAPGSIHPSGERVEWNADGEPAAIDPDVLRDAVNKLADSVEKRLGLSRNGVNGHQAKIGSGKFSLPNIVDRARKYLDKIPPAVSGSGGHDQTFHAACVLVQGFSLERGSALQLLREWNQRCEPPWDDRDLEHKIDDAMAAPGERGYLLNENLVENLPPSNQPPAKARDDNPFRKPIIVQSLLELREKHHTLATPVIEGLQREGETANIIAPPKFGKSWMVYGLAIAVNMGRPWLDTFYTRPGQVLLIDNELHPETIAHRLPIVGDAMGIHYDDYNRGIDVVSLRGNLRSLLDLQTFIESIEPGRYKLIIFDAKYRFAVEGVSENDNAAEARNYNLLDQYAAHTRAAITLIHHSTKGQQGEKRVVDVGAGAGSQARAADCHIVLREHEEDGLAVLDAAVRSFAPVEPLALRWTFPVWQRDEWADPTRLKGKLTANEERQAQSDKQGIDAIIKALRDGPGTARQLRPRTGVSKDRLQRLLDKLEFEEQIEAVEVNARGNKTKQYSIPESEE